MSTTTTPNGVLQSVRKGMLLSQDEFAERLRIAGERAGEPNNASKRYVQRLESGVIATPRPLYARALEAVTGLPIEALGFASPAPMARVTGDNHGGHDVDNPAMGIAAAAGTGQPRPAQRGNYSGVWLSRYEYFSSGRDKAFVGQHYVTVIQHGDRLTVRSLPGSSDSPLTMDLTVDGAVVTGTWVEQTSPDSYYRGARYHGAIQMLAEPTGRRIAGKWVGFGKELDVNTGPWELVFQEGSTDRATLERYNRRPEPDDM